MASRKESKVKLEHIVFAGVGALVGATWARSQVEEAKKSRCEIEDPDGVSTPALFDSVFPELSEREFWERIVPFPSYI